MQTVVEEYQRLNAEIKALQKRQGEIKDIITKAYQDEISAQLDGNDYGAGTATVNADGYSLKFVKTKKVKWEQDKLAHLYSTLNDPTEYIKVEYSVPENAYKNWPRGLQELFEPARTVDISKPTLTVECKDE